MSKNTTLLAVACLSILTLPLCAMACDDDEKSKCGTKEAAAKLVAAESGCSSTCETEAAKAKLVAADGGCSSTCETKAAKAKLVAADGGCSSTCETKAAEAKLIAADGGCTSTCDTQKATGARVLSVASGATCGDAKTTGAKVVAASDASCESSCPAEKTATLLVRAIERMDAQCDSSREARADVLAALQTMTKAKPGIVCSEKLASLAGTKTDLTTYEVAMSTVLAKPVSETKSSSSCNGAATAALAAGTTTSCASDAKAKQAGALAATCDGGAKAKLAVASASTCEDSVEAKQVLAAGATCEGSVKAKPVLAGGATCEGATKARFVAYDCEKTDRVARAAARAYLELMHEIKRYTGAEACAGQTATQVLAAVLEEMHSEATAQAASAEADETTVSVVSFGAVGDGPKCEGASRSACCPEKK